MEPFVYQNPTKIIFGEGKVGAIVDEAKASLGTNLLLVTGKGSARKSGLLGEVLGLLKGGGFEITLLEGVDPNPRIETVAEGARLAREKGIAGLVAVGGGSVVDCAKGIAIAAANDGDPWDFYRRERTPTGEPLPVGVILTLAATGSEANGNSVVSRPSTGEKRAIYHPGLFPRFSILDPALTATTPLDQTAFGVVDILSHLYEQYFHNVESTPISDGIAETLMRTLITAAPKVMRKPKDLNTRGQILWSSTVALMGLVKAGARGDWSCHMLSHELSGRYDTPHGGALAVVFPAWMRMGYQENLPRFTRFATEVWRIDGAGLDDETLAMAGIEAMERFYTETLKVGIRLGDYGVGDERIDEMAKAAAEKNPLFPLFKITEEKAARLFRSAL